MSRKDIECDSCLPDRRADWEEVIIKRFDVGLTPLWIPDAFVDFEATSKYRPSLVLTGGYEKTTRLDQPNRIGYDLLFGQSPSI
jgi:hypothetical protein